MGELEDLLKHHGVKGMKWGVRKKSNSGSSQNGSKVDAAKNFIKSKGRELSLVNKTRVSKMDKLTTKELRAQANRLRLENELKRLSGNVYVRTKKDVKDYHRRAKMSDSELNRKVNRLRVKADLKKQAKDANSFQLALGKKIIALAAPVAIGYVTAKAPDIAKKLIELNSAENRKLLARVVSGAL